MKNLIIPILFAFPLLAFAQHQQDQKLSPEQRATLQAKKWPCTSTSAKRKNARP